MIPYNGKLKNHARRLRKDMTDAEKLVWSRIRRKQLEGCQFYRQRIIGNCIVDFYCPKAGLVVEIDGGQHYSEAGIKRDEARDNYMTANGLRVLRFSDRDVFEDTDAVIERIFCNLPLS